MKKSKIIIIIVFIIIFIVTFIKILNINPEKYSLNKDTIFVNFNDYINNNPPIELDFEHIEHFNDIINVKDNNMDEITLYKKYKIFSTNNNSEKTKYEIQIFEDEYNNSYFMNILSFNLEKDLFTNIKPEDLFSFDNIAFDTFDNPIYRIDFNDNYQYYLFNLKNNISKNYSYYAVEKGMVIIAVTRANEIFAHFDSNYYYIGTNINLSKESVIEILDYLSQINFV